MTEEQASNESCVTLVLHLIDSNQMRVTFFVANIHPRTWLKTNLKSQTYLVSIFCANSQTK